LLSIALYWMAEVSLIKTTSPFFSWCFAGKCVFSNHYEWTSTAHLHVSNDRYLDVLTLICHSKAAELHMPIPAYLASLSNEEGEGLFTHMQTCLHLALTISPLVAILPRKYDKTSVRRDKLIVVCIPISSWAVLH
jgi:hypothetical protein